MKVVLLYLGEPADGPDHAAVGADLGHVAEVHYVGAAGEVLAHVDRLLPAGP